jgi:hypothetical protein
MHGSTDRDPYQNDMDPKQWYQDHQTKIIFYEAQRITMQYNKVAYRTIYLEERKSNKLYYFNTSKDDI